MFSCVCSPLHIAAKSGLVKVVIELLNRGAELNSRDNDGEMSGGEVRLNQFPNFHLSKFDHFSVL